MLRPLAAALLACSLCPSPALADPSPAYFVKDVDTTPAGFGVAPMGDTSFLLVGTPETGSELWKTDGTHAGTAMVKEIRPGPNGSGPNLLGMVGGAVWFTAHRDDLGTELWKSDGTEAGTVLIEDINPGPGSGASGAEGAVIGSTLYFVGIDSVHGAELWKSDGTEAGTVLVADIRPGAFSSGLYGLTVSNGTLFFAANDGPSNHELWKSDGTSAGTVQVKDIVPGAGGSFPESLTARAGTLYFIAGAPLGEGQLWKSDGTEAGTVPVQDPVPGPLAVGITQLTNVDGTFFFWASDELGGALWKSDGTSAGTVRLATVPAEFWVGIIEPTAVGSRFFFWVNPPSSFTAELWTSDGTVAGTVPIDVLGDVDDPEYPWGNDFHLTSSGGSLYFSAPGALFSDDTELWKSDGTAAGTVRVKDIEPGAAGSDPSALTHVNGELWFSAHTSTDGGQLWRSDGSSAGTVPITAFASTESSDLTSFTDLDGTLIFYPRGLDREPWKSDGTPAGTVQVKNIHPNGNGLELFSAQTRFTDVNGTMFFAADDGVHGRELWKTDGTQAGTALVKDIRPGSGPIGSDPQGMLNVNGTLYFRANNGTHGVELWKSDGTTAGTVMVRDHNPGSGSGAVSGPTLFAGALFFGGNNGVSGSELWKTDGTSAGTTLVADIWLGSGSSTPGGFAIVGGFLVFSATTSTEGRELFKADGTQFGTSLVKDIRPGSASSDIQAVTELGGSLIFQADDGVTGRELWKSDGTSAGTQLVKDIAPGSDHGFYWHPPLFAVAGGAAFFRVDTVSSTGEELWKTDGTTAGTVMVEDIFPVPGIGGALSDPVAVGSVVVFVGKDDVWGAGPWLSDGTPEGTHRFAPVRVTAGESGSFLASGPLLYFEGTTDATGSELYAIPLSALDGSASDTDADGLVDDAEAVLGTNPLVADSDGDGLADGAEVNLHLTHPLLADTDGDGVDDGDEIEDGTDPLDPQDFVAAVPLGGPLGYAALAALLALAARRPRNAP
jgi:ELWxxDGT repeat protein